MLILNFSHPLTDSQKQQVESITGQEIVDVKNIPSQMDNARPFADQIRGMVDALNISSRDWQTLSILINPPAYNFSAVTLLAELHGRMGYFPAILRVRPTPDQTPPRYEVAEIINLQTLRAQARARR